VVVGPQDAYYQRASDIYPHGPEPRPTGLWRVRPDGTIERWDDAFSRLPWAGGLVHEDGDVIVAEAHDGGVDGRVNGIGFHLNGTAGSFWPRVAVEGERVAIVWDNRSLAPSTVNLWVGTKADLLAYPPLPLPVPSEPEPISPDPVEEPTPMRDFPLTDMLRQFAAKFPVPQLQPGEAIEALEERARQWTVRFCEQAACVSASYGAKRADPTRPISKDVLAWHGVAEFVGWDLLSGVGTGAPTLNDGLAGRPLPSTYDLTGQVFVPVNAKDWLGFYVTPQPVPDPIIPTPVTPDPATPVPAPAPTVPERDRLERSITAFCRAWLGV
jgi:hypothetical protein